MLWPNLILTTVLSQLTSLVLSSMDLHSFPSGAYFRRFELNQIPTESPNLNQQEPGVIVNTSRGAVEGAFYKTPKGTDGIVFLGIPYAQPPLGKLRFMPPKNMTSWRGIIQAKAYKPGCLQIKARQGRSYHQMNEDCLYINIFLPPDAPHRAATKQSLYPVIYYMHGGAWEFDSPDMFPVDNLLNNFVSRDVIFVTFGYRLGLMGFWSTGTQDAPGNNALKDAILGLQWIQKEIKHFGGDPKRVTLQGHSSAGMGVSMLTMTPATDGLFHQAAAMSGSALGSTINNDLSAFRNVAEKFGCADRNAWDKEKFSHITSCLQRVDGDAMNDYYLSVRESGSAPRIDGVGGILPKRIWELAQTRKSLTYVIGTTSNEWGFNAASLPDATSATMAEECQSFATLLAGNRGQSVAAACIARFVDAHKDVHADYDHKFWGHQVANFDSAMSMYAPSYKDADLMRKAGGEVYMYSFEFVKEGYNEEFEPSHAFDLTYLIGIHPFNMTKRDYAMRDTYSKLFADFAKVGNKKTPWKPLGSPIGFQYLKVDLEPQMQDFYHFDDVQFFTSVVPNILSFGSCDTAFPYPDYEITSDRSFEWMAATNAVEPNKKINSGLLAVLGLLIACLAVLLIVTFWKPLRRLSLSRKQKIYENDMVAEFEPLAADSRELYSI